MAINCQQPKNVLPESMTDGGSLLPYYAHADSFAQLLIKLSFVALQMRLSLRMSHSTLHRVSRRACVSWVRRGSSTVNKLSHTYRSVKLSKLSLFKCVLPGPLPHPLLLFLHRDAESREYPQSFDPQALIGPYPISLLSLLPLCLKIEYLFFDRPHTQLFFCSCCRYVPLSSMVVSFRVKFVFYNTAGRRRLSKQRFGQHPWSCPERISSY